MDQNTLIRQSITKVKEVIGKEKAILVKLEELLSGLEAQIVIEPLKITSPNEFRFPLGEASEVYLTANREDVSWSGGPKPNSITDGAGRIGLGQDGRLIFDGTGEEKTYHLAPVVVSSGDSDPVNQLIKIHAFQPEAPIVIKPPQILEPVDPQSDTEDLLSLLKLGNTRIIQVEDLTHTSTIYSAPQPALGFGFNLTAMFCCDHGGNVYNVFDGSLYEKAVFHGGYIGRQWDDRESRRMWAQKGNAVFTRLLNNKPQMVTNLDELNSAYPSLKATKLYAGPNEGRFVNKGLVQLTASNASRGFLVTYDSVANMWLDPVEIPFDWADGQPDFGSSAILDQMNYFYKNVVQRGQNWDIPWMIVNKRKVSFSERVLNGHAASFVFDNQDAIICINGEVTSMITHKLLTKYPGMTSLSSHVGPVEGKGQKFIVHDDASGRIRLTSPRGTHKIITDQATGKFEHYVTAGANEDHTAVFFLGKDNHRYIALSS